MIGLPDFSEHLKTIKKSEWARLFDLLPQIEKTQIFDKEKKLKKLKSGAITMPYWDPSEIVLKFCRVVADLDLVPVFDWVHWEEGKQILKSGTQNFEVFDTTTLCKLFTLIIRADRFSDGNLVGNFANSTIPNIIRVLKNRILDEE